MNVREEDETKKVYSVDGAPFQNLINEVISCESMPEGYTLRGMGLETVTATYDSVHTFLTQNEQEIINFYKQTGG